MRKFASVSVAFIFAAGVMTASPAPAAPKISNGVACTKIGAAASVSGTKYKCGTNQLTTSKKLIWLSVDCITSTNSYKQALKSSTEISAQLAAQIPVIDLKIADANVKKAESQTKLDASNLRLTGAQAKLAASTSAADKRVLTTAVGSWTSAIRAYTSNLNRITLSIKKLEASKLIAVTQPTQLASNVASIKANAVLICTKGL